MEFRIRNPDGVNMIILQWNGRTDHRSYVVPTGGYETLPLQDYPVNLLKEWSYASDIDSFFVVISEDGNCAIGMNLSDCPRAFLKDCRFQFSLVLVFVQYENPLSYCVIKIQSRMIFLVICFGDNTLFSLEQFFPVYFARKWKYHISSKGKLSRGVIQGHVDSCSDSILSSHTLSQNQGCYIFILARWIFTKTDSYHCADRLVHAFNDGI